MIRETPLAASENIGKDQSDPTSGPLATSGPRPLVTRPVKLFVSLLPAATSRVIFFTQKDFKVSWSFSFLMLYV
jgi:hypothetical protein